MINKNIYNKRKLLLHCFFLLIGLNRIALVPAIFTKLLYFIVIFLIAIPSILPQKNEKNFELYGFLPRL